VSGGLYTLAPIEEAGWAPEPVSMIWRSENFLTAGTQNPNPVTQPVAGHYPGSPRLCSE
jgi:hypothetical protein